MDAESQDTEVKAAECTLSPGEAAASGRSPSVLLADDSASSRLSCARRKPRKNTPFDEAASCKKVRTPSPKLRRSIRNKSREKWLELVSELPEAPETGSDEYDEFLRGLYQVEPDFVQDSSAGSSEEDCDYDRRDRASVPAHPMFHHKVSLLSLIEHPDKDFKAPNDVTRERNDV